MNRRNVARNRAWLSAVGVLASTAGLAAGFATAQDIPQPPLTQLKDAHGVNLGTGDFSVPWIGINIGGQGSGLDFQRFDETDASSPVTNHTHNMAIIPAPNPAPSGGAVLAHVSYAGKVYRFYVGYWSSYKQNQHYNYGPYTALESPEILNCTDNDLTSTVGSCTLTLEDGTSVFYDRSLARPGAARQGDGVKTTAAIGTQAIRPDGEVIDTNYGNYNGVVLPYGFKSARSSLGWMLKWATDLKAINTSVVYCDFAATDCTVPSNFPVVSGVVTNGVTQMYQNGVHLVSYSGVSAANYDYTLSITYPSARTKTMVKKYWTNSLSVREWDVNVTEAGKLWKYRIWKDDYPATAVNFKTTVTNPDQTLRYANVYRSGAAESVKDELSRTTVYAYAGANPGADSQLLTRVTPPEGTALGGYTSYTYDTRNRIKTMTNKAKAGSGLADQVTTVEYMETAVPCVNPKTCNKPLWIDDAKGNRTDFTYYAHGGVATVTHPADSNGVRPQTRSYYTQLYPKVRDAANNLVNSTPVWRLTRTETCGSSTNSCAGTADESVILYEYNQNNLLPTATISKSGNADTAQAYSASNLWQKTEYGYDDIGNQVWIDGPRTDVDDRSYTTYDLLRRKVFEISSDPDGSGGLTRVVIKHSYDVDGREWLTETGTGNTTTFANGVPTGVSDFGVASFKRNTFDTVTGLLIKTEVGQP